MNSQTPLDYAKYVASPIYAEIKDFFGSPIFFILLGCSFLFFAAKLMEDTHPSFVFLLAILGVSIVLYGTGTQGVGTAELKNVPIKVAVAGGAGVLAAVFGFGIVWQSKNIQEVFKAERQYAVVVLQNESDQLFDLTTLRISARSPDGRELHFLSRANSLEILVPITSFSPRSPVCVTVTHPTGKSMTDRNACPNVAWGSDTDHAYGELVNRVGTGILPLVPPKAAQLDEQSRPTERYDFTPQ
jgi:hypothetical protein